MDLSHSENVEKKVKKSLQLPFNYLEKEWFLPESPQARSLSQQIPFASEVLKVPKAPPHLASPRFGNQFSKPDKHVLIFVVKYTWQCHLTHVTIKWPSWSSFLTTCQVRAIAPPDGSTTTTRALLDSASSTRTSFVTEQLAQGLQLLCQYCHLQISGIGSITVHSRSCAIP